MVLISNGLDQYSKARKEDIIAAARKNDVIVHTIGIGEATKPQNVNTVLVLDHSGSMEAPADDDDDPEDPGPAPAGQRFVGKAPTLDAHHADPVQQRGRRRRAVAAKSAQEDDKQRTSSPKSRPSSPTGNTPWSDAVFAALATLEARTINRAGRSWWP